MTITEAAVAVSATATAEMVVVVGKDSENEAKYKEKVFYWIFFHCIKLQKPIRTCTESLYSFIQPFIHHSLTHIPTIRSVWPLAIAQMNFNSLRYCLWK